MLPCFYTVSCQTVLQIQEQKPLLHLVNGIEGRVCLVDKTKARVQVLYMYKLNYIHA